MRFWGRVAALAAAGLVLAGCARPGAAEMDKQAETLATAISWPRQYSGEGFARAALATPLGQGSSFSILEVTDFDVVDPAEPMAYLVIRLHRDGVDGKGGRTDPLTRCYGLSFNQYGIIGAPETLGCPENADPITYPPAPAWADPAAFDAAFAAVLDGLPAAPSRKRVENALYGAWLLEAAVLVSDTEWSIGPNDPRPVVAVRGDDVAVAIVAGPECLLGARVRGAVTTSRPAPPVAECVPSFG